MKKELDASANPANAEEAEDIMLEQETKMSRRNAGPVVSGKRKGMMGCVVGL